MNKMILSHKIKLNPTLEQEVFFLKSCGTVRFAYNWGLAEWKRQYEAGLKPSAMSLKKEFNAIKKGQYPWVYEVSGRCTEYGFARLGVAFKNFFRRVKNGEKPGYPKFKSRHDNHQSFYVANTEIGLNGHWLHIPRLDTAINMAETLRFDGKIMSAVISRDGLRWWVSIAVEMDADLSPAVEQEAIGVDLGTMYTAVLSDGKVYDNPQPLAKAQRKLARLQRKLARQQPNSNKRQKTKDAINKLHYRIRCLREDAQHKVTTEIAGRYAVVAIEDFDVRRLMQRQKGQLRRAYQRRRARQLADAAIGEVRRQLGYKVIRHGGVFLKTPEFYASNQICYHCDHEDGSVKPGMITWQCQHCGRLNDRRLNSALNIRNEAIKLIP